MGVCDQWVAMLEEPMSWEFERFRSTGGRSGGTRKYVLLLLNLKLLS